MSKTDLTKTEYLQQLQKYLKNCQRQIMKMLWSISPNILKTQTTKVQKL